MVVAEVVLMTVEWRCETSQDERLETWSLYRSEGRCKLMRGTERIKTHWIEESHRPVRKHLYTGELDEL